MIEEVVHTASRLDDPIGLLIALSPLRDELPWMWELAVEGYRAMITGDPAVIQQTARRMELGISFAMHTRGPALVRKNTYYLLRELPLLLERFVPQTPLPPADLPTRVVKKKPTEEP